MTSTNQSLAQRATELLTVAEKIGDVPGIAQRLRDFPGDVKSPLDVGALEDSSLRNRDGWNIPNLAYLASVHHGASALPADLEWLLPSIPSDEDAGKLATQEGSLAFLTRSLDEAIGRRLSAVSLGIALAEARDRCLQDQARGGDIRRQGDQARQSVQDVFAGLRESIPAAIRKGVQFDDVRRLIQQLDRKHLVTEQRSAGTALSVDSTFVARVDTAVQGPALVGLNHAQERIEREIARLVERLSKSLGIGVVGLAPSPLNRDDMRQRVVGELKVDVGAGVNQPPRGFMQRVSEGRRPLYVILMMVSLFGTPLGLKRGPGVTIAMAFLFLGGILFTYRSWKTQDLQQKDKLVGDARKRLGDSASRAEEEYYRTAQTSLTSYLAEALRQTQRSLDDSVKARLELASKRATEERESIRSRMERDQARAKELEGYAGTLQAAKAPVHPPEVRSVSPR